MQEDDASGIAEDVVAPDAERDDIAETEAPEVEDEASDAEAPDAEFDTEDGDDEGDVEGESDEDDDFVELNLGGKTVRLDGSQTAKEAAAMVQQFADETWRAHTARSEEVAETRKALQARAEAVDKLQSMDDQAFGLFAQAKQLDTSIAGLEQQLGTIDRHADPDNYRFVSDDLVRYRQASEQVRGALAQAEAQSGQARAAEMQRLQQEGEAKVRKVLPKFDETAVIDYVTTKYEGFDKVQASSSWALNPAFAIMAHKAMEHDRMLARANKASRPDAKKAKPVKPVARKGGPARQNLADLSPEEFHKRRMEQRRNRG